MINFFNQKLILRVFKTSFKFIKIYIFSIFYPHSDFVHIFQILVTVTGTSVRTGVVF